MLYVFNAVGNNFGADQAGAAQRRPALLTEQEPMTDVMAAYRDFDRRQPGWIKVALDHTLR